MNYDYISMLVVAKGSQNNPLSMAEALGKSNDTMSLVNILIKRLCT